METFIAGLGALGGVATAISIIYLAQQTTISNHLARVGAHDRLTDLALEVDRMFIERPELRKYFYNGESPHGLDCHERERLLAATEFVCDFMENALLHKAYKGSRVIGGWTEYCQQLIRDSAVLREFLHVNRVWYDDALISMLDEIETYRGKAILTRSGQIDVQPLDSADPADRAELVRQARLIYETSFPYYERVDSNDLFRDESGRTILVAVEAGAVLGFASLLDLPASEACLLEYLAVSVDRRSGGLGTILLDASTLYARDRGANQLLMELEAPDVSGDATRRLRFYERNGCAPVPWLDRYVIPDLSDPRRSIDMILYSRVLDDRAGPFDTRHLLTELYQRAYGAAGELHLQELLTRVTAD